MNSRSATATPARMRHRDAVAGRQRRVGGDREALPGTAGGDHRVRGRARPRARRRADRRATPTARPSSTSRSVTSQLSRISAPDVLHRGDQRPLDLGAGGVAAGVHDPRRPSDRLPAAQGESAAVDLVEVRAERHELAHARRALAGRGPRTASVSQRPAPAARVSEPCSSGESSSAIERGGHTALRVAGRRPPELALGEHGDRQPGVPGAHGRGDRPATPLPSTRSRTWGVGHGQRSVGATVAGVRRTVGDRVHRWVGCARRRARRSARSPRARPRRTARR